jgi:hypothetical protein
MAKPESYPQLVIPGSMQLEVDGQLVGELRPEMIEMLAWMAVRNRTSCNVIIEQAIRNEDFLEREEAAGSKLIIQKDDELRYLVRAPASPF